MKTVKELAQEIVEKHFDDKDAKYCAEMLGMSERDVRKIALDMGKVTPLTVRQKKYYERSGVPVELIDKITILYYQDFGPSYCHKQEPSIAINQYKKRAKYLGIKLSVEGKQAIHLDLNTNKKGTVNKRKAPHHYPVNLSELEHLALHKPWRKTVRELTEAQTV